MPQHGETEIVTMTGADLEWEAVFAAQGENGEVSRIPVACWAAIRTYMGPRPAPKPSKRRPTPTGRKAPAKPKKLPPRVPGRWVTRTVGLVPFKQDLVPADELADFLGYDNPVMESRYEEDAMALQGEPDPKPKPGTNGGMGGMIN